METIYYNQPTDQELAEAYAQEDVRAAQHELDEATRALQDAQDRREKARRALGRANVILKAVRG